MGNSTKIILKLFGILVIIGSIFIYMLSVATFGQYDSLTGLAVFLLFLGIILFIIGKKLPKSKQICGSCGFMAETKRELYNHTLTCASTQHTPEPETTFGSVLRPEPETTPEPETKIHSTNTIKTNESDDPVEILKIRMSKGEITVEEIDKIPKSFFESDGLPNSPSEILKKRYAIGEITLDEFNKIKENLEKF